MGGIAQDGEGCPEKSTEVLRRKAIDLYFRDDVILFPWILVGWDYGLLDMSSQATPWQSTAIGAV